MEEERGIPYTVGEARTVVEMHKMDLYHKEIIEWLCDQVEELMAKLEVGSSKNSMSNFRIYKEKAGVISENEIWVCSCTEKASPDSVAGYMYTADTSEQLIMILNTEWEHDKHLIGN